VDPVDLTKKPLYKYITDEANESSGQEWSTLVNQGQNLFIEKLQSWM
jgi:adenosylhomocysteine nucleosidase